MIIIGIFMIIQCFSEFLRRKIRKNKISSNLSSVVKLKEEFKSSWSIINSLRSSGADSPYLTTYVLLISFFLPASPLHLKIFYYLCLLLLYSLLPLMNTLITRLSFFVNCKNEEENIINKKNEEYEKEIEDNNIDIITSSDNNSNHFFNNKYKELLNLFLDWSEVILIFIIIHLIGEYICFSIYAWLYAAGENANFEVCSFHILSLFNYF